MITNSTAIQLYELNEKLTELECSLRKRIGLVLWATLRSRYKALTIQILTSSDEVNVKEFVDNLTFVDSFKNSDYDDLLLLFTKLIEIKKHEMSLGDTYKTYRGVDSGTDLTYANNWDYIQSLKDNTVKETLFNFINSLLYRGEKLWMFGEGSALTLVALRNCSDEAQEILENSKGN